ncbi:MAG TPA: type II secretion system F family protein [Gaiellaceae bacterium]|nr:type II secretion system F family protein [Gaiellaceae bacterium]
MRVGRKRALAALTVAAAAWLAPSAAAGGQPRLVEVGGAADFPKRAFVLTLPGKRSLTAGDVRVLENGEPVSELSLAPAGSSGGEASGVVLLIDASESMAGAPIRNAMAAARAFAAQRMPSQQLAVLAYNAHTETVLPFTSEADEIDHALSRTPRIAYYTRMYEAIDEAISMIEREELSPGSIVLLSDGQEVGSLGSPDAVIARAGEARVRIFSVGLRSRYYRATTLSALATKTGGRYREASSPTALTAIYAKLGAQLAREYVLRYTSTASPSQKVRVAVRIKGEPGLAVSGYTSPGRSLTPSRPYRDSIATQIAQSPLTMLAVALTAAGLIAFALYAAVRRRPRTLQARMAEFVSIRTPRADAGGAGDSRVASRVLVGAERSLETTKWWGRFKETLELAEIRMPAIRIFLWTAAATLLTMLLLAVVCGSPVFAIFGLAVPLIARSLIHRKLARRRKLFSEQLPDNLQVLASALRAGHSFIGALSVVIDDADEPSRGEFRRIVADEQLGVLLEDAVRTVVVRMDNEDLEQVALVAALQRRTGSDMAEVLERVTETIRERFELRRMVQTLTTQGRMSRWIVSALPVVLLLAITVINPEYTEPLFTTTGGRLVLMLAAVMLVAGSLVIKRIVNIKV